jgi:peptidoglycan-associated lipoprotein
MRGHGLHMDSVILRRRLTMKKIGIAILMISTAFLIGCPKKPTIVKEEAKAPVAEVKPEAKPEVKPEAKPVEVAKVAEEKPRELTAAERLAKLKEEFRFEDIHFDYDRYDIEERGREILKNLADWLSTNKGIEILIEGHADERGTNEYNLALGDRRANTVKQYLVTLGVNAERISTITYGEEKPICTGPGEECWAENRRAHFTIKE